MQSVDVLLKNSGLRKTDIRRKVATIFLKAQAAQSQAQIEHALGGNIDRVTLYRTLRTFENSGLIHKAVDATETVKYALCAEDCHAEEPHQHEHVHFHCKQCGQTFCVENVSVHIPQLPKQYKVESAYMVAEGRCADCD